MSQEHILIVDDEKNIVGTLKKILMDEGYNVSIAEDGLFALDMVQSDPPDLILLDIWLPGMDGIEVLKTVKTYHPSIEVLIMSGHGTIDTAVKATKLGAFDFIEKPFSMDHLIQSVNNVFKFKKNLPRKPVNHLTTDNKEPTSFAALMEVKKFIKIQSQTDNPILILGEKGTGKEFIAKAIHREGTKSSLPFIKLNCTTRRMQEIQSFLFPSPKKELANENKSSKTKPTTHTSRVIFLDNVNALTKTMQEKLTKVLHAEGIKKQNFLPSRLYISSSKNLKELSKNGQFNSDLLKMFKDSTIHIPPLRKNPSSIPVMIRDHLEKTGQVDGQPAPQFDSAALDALCRYNWPENIRELHSVLDRIVATAPSREHIPLSEIPPGIRRKGTQIKTEHFDKLSCYPQRTLKRSVVLCGSGLHLGLKTGLILQPLPPGSGIIFGDISSGQTIPAHLENIKSTDYSTTLRKGRSSVATIEHIMAVLHMYRITNLLIKIGDEVPVMDGSAKDFCDLIEDGEFDDQDEFCQELIIDKKYTFRSNKKGESHISIEPSETLKVSYHMEYPAPIGIMDHTFEYKGEESFKKEIAPARTFGFMQDVAQLTKMGFASGGKLDNFILLGDDKIINTQLRFKNEFPRHKILDILGDFYLLGKPIRGHIRAHKSGHSENIGLLKTLFRAGLQ